MQPNPALLLAKKFAKLKEAGKLDRKTVKIVPRGNFPALPYKPPRPSPGACATETSIASRGLEFLFLTASRTSEVIGAKWIEIDLDARLWTIPPERLKTGKKTRKPHVVPLSPRAIAILEEMREIRVSDFVFPGRFDGQPLARPGAARGGQEAGACPDRARPSLDVSRLGWRGDGLRRRARGACARPRRRAASKAATGAGRRSIGAALLWMPGQIS